jgi:hypothetical protein
MSEQAGRLSAEKAYKPGDRALILFRDGEWRPAQLSPGFIWVTADGGHWLAAEGGFEARPLLSVLPPAATEGGER